MMSRKLCIASFVFLILGGIFSVWAQSEGNSLSSKINLFETEEEIDRLTFNNAVIEMSSQFSTEGKYSGKVTFHPGTSSISLEHGKGFSSGDWSDYGMLCFDIYNPNEKRVSLQIALSSPDGTLYWNVFYLPSHRWETVRISLLLPYIYIMAEDLWKVNEVASLSIFRHQPDTLSMGDYFNPQSEGDFSVYIDNIRLLTKAEAFDYFKLPGPLAKEDKAKFIGAKKSEVADLDLMQIAKFRSLKIFWMESEKLREDVREDIASHSGFFDVIKRYQINYYIGAPSSQEQLKDYDIVIFDDVSSDNFSEEQLNMVKEFYQSGGAVVMGGGGKGFAGVGVEGTMGYKDTPIEDVLPVKLSSPPDIDWGPRIDTPQLVLPNHPIFAGISTDEILELYFDAPYNSVLPKPEASVILIDGVSLNKDPVVVVGPRALCFTVYNRGAVRKWSQWERFVIQGFNYITKDRKRNRSVIAKVKAPATAGAGKEFAGEIVISNPTQGGRNLSLKTTLLSPALKSQLTEKEITCELKPGEIKHIDFSLPISADFPIEGYTVNFSLYDKDTILKMDAYDVALQLKPVSFLEVYLPRRPWFENGNFNPELKIVNSDAKNSEKVTLRTVLYQKDKLVRILMEKEIEISANEEKKVDSKLSLKGIKRGSYEIVCSISSEGKLVDEVRKKFRIQAEYKPLLERDFVYHPYAFGAAAIDELLALDPRFEDLDLFRFSYGPMDLSLGERYLPILGGKAIRNVDLKAKLLPIFNELGQREIPFTINVLSSWDLTEPYEAWTRKIRTVLDWADEVAGDYFAGIFVWEMRGLATFHATQRAKTRAEKVETFKKLFKKLVSDIGVPEDKVVGVINDSTVDFGLFYEAGANTVGIEYFLWGEVPIIIASEARGKARSFNGKWAVSMAFWDELPTRFIDPHTGRFNPDVKEPWGLWKWNLDEVYKSWIETYYQGANWIHSQSEVPLAPHPPERAEKIKEFMDFVEEHPRGKDVVSKIAVVRSKGDSWHGPRAIDFLARQQDPPYNLVYGIDYWYLPDKDKFLKPRKEEADFAYIDVFYPGFSAYSLSADFNGAMAANGNWWTGTPYGPVDFISPAMKLEKMKRYNTILFFGYNRMDLIRQDFLSDMKEYVKDGGIVLLSIDQLKDSNDNLNMEVLSELAGVRIGSQFFTGITPKLPVSEYIEVISTTPFNLRKEKYAIDAKTRLYEEEAPWLYKAIPTSGEVAAVDGNGNPVLIVNRYGKGYVLLFTTPTLSMIPQYGRNKFVIDVIKKISRYKTLPVTLSPESKDMEIVLSRTDDKEATIFLMNHGATAWGGEIIVDMDSGGLSSSIKRVTAAVSEGNKTVELTPSINRRMDNIIITGIRLKGDDEDFISYRNASFAVLRLGN